MVNNKKFGGAFLAGAVTLSWMVPALAEASAGKSAEHDLSAHAYRLMRTTPQIMEHPDRGEPFAPLDGSYTHIVYAPERATFHADAVDLALGEWEDSDGINRILNEIIKLEKTVGRTPELLQCIIRTIAPRYARFMRRAFPELGYLLVHQPSIVNGTFFSIILDMCMEARGSIVGLSDMMHDISVESALFYTEELDVFICRLAHEMAHRAREHVIERCYYMGSCNEEERSLLSHDQENEADRIALLVLRDERYIKAQIKKFAQEIDYPYQIDEKGEICGDIIIQQTGSHPSHYERLYNTLAFWIELVVKRDGVLEEEARDIVAKQYRSLLTELELQASTIQKLRKLLA